MSNVNKSFQIKLYSIITFKFTWIIINKNKYFIKNVFREIEELRRRRIWKLNNSISFIEFYNLIMYLFFWFFIHFIFIFISIFIFIYYKSCLYIFITFIFIIIDVIILFDILSFVIFRKYYLSSERNFFSFFSLLIHYYHC